jgi:hypothetical protein
MYWDLVYSFVRSLLNVTGKVHKKFKNLKI